MESHSAPRARKNDPPLPRPRAADAPPDRPPIRPSARRPRSSSSASSSSSSSSSSSNAPRRPRPPPRSRLIKILFRKIQPDRSSTPDTLEPDDDDDDDESRPARPLDFCRSFLTVMNDIQYQNWGSEFIHCELYIERVRMVFSVTVTDGVQVLVLPPPRRSDDDDDDGDGPTSKYELRPDLWSAFDVRAQSDEQIDRLLAFCRQTIGQPYDMSYLVCSIPACCCSCYLPWARWFCGGCFCSDDRWNCSSLIYTALTTSGILKRRDHFARYPSGDGGGGRRPGLALTDPFPAQHLSSTDKATRFHDYWYVPHAPPRSSSSSTSRSRTYCAWDLSQHGPDDAHPDDIRRLAVGRQLWASEYANLDSESATPYALYRLFSRLSELTARHQSYQQQQQQRQRRRRRRQDRPRLEPQPPPPPSVSVTAQARLPGQSSLSPLKK